MIYIIYFIKFVEMKYLQSTIISSVVYPGNECDNGLLGGTAELVPSLLATQVREAVQGVGAGPGEQVQPLGRWGGTLDVAGHVTQGWK